MLAPSKTLVVDAAILIAAVIGRGAGALMEAGEDTSLVTTDRVLEEAAGRLELGMGRPDLLEKLTALTSTFTVVPVSRIAHHLPAGELCLREAVASRNGSTRDAHVLALAWEADADIWTTDRNFAGAGVATWSTPNLMRALIKAQAA